MHKLILSFFAALCVSTVAMAADDAPVSEGAIPSGYVWFSGGSVAYLKNEKGVVIKVHSQSGGLKFNLSANGMHITLE